MNNDAWWNNLDDGQWQTLEEKEDQFQGRERSAMPEPNLFESFDAWLLACRKAEEAQGIIFCASCHEPRRMNTEDLMNTMCSKCGGEAK